MAARVGRRRIPKTVRRFVPPHCPNPGCPFFDPARRAAWKVHRDGCQRILRAPGWVSCFRCRHCGRAFRNSSFLDDYWKKKPGLHARVFVLLNNGQGLRQAGRTLRVAPNTVRNRQRQLAGQCLLGLLEMRGRLHQQLASQPRFGFDGLRDKAGSLYEPCDVQTLLMSETQLFVDVELVGLRRSGQMSPKQRSVRAARDRKLGRPKRGERVRKTRNALELILELIAPSVQALWDTDEEPDYARAHAQLPRRRRRRIRHRQTSSKVRRDESNPLWRINHVHRLMRHSLANLKRKTIALSKTAAGLLDRVLLFACWLNQVKGISERRVKDARTTPAMLMGLESRPRAPRSLFRRRRFPGHYALTKDQREAYRGSFKARPREITKPYIKSYAY